MENKLIKALNRPDMNDPLVQQINWTLLNKGAASFSTHEIIKPTPGKLVFKVTNFTIGFYSLFIIWGVGLILLAAYKLNPLTGIIGIIILAIAMIMMDKGIAPFIFDKRNNSFRKGNIKPTSNNKNNKKQISGQLRNIHAIQLIPQFHTDSEGGSYYTYELNLVLKNTNRINVINHRGKESVLNKAKQLSVFLDIPIWDADAI